MKKTIAGLLSVGVALAVPALVVAQVSRFTENEPLTVARMDQLVSAINNVNFAQPVQLPAVTGSTTGGPTTRVFTAPSAGLLLFVPSGGGFADIEASVSATTTTGVSTVARSFQGNTITVPIGIGQSVTLSFTNTAGQTPSMNVYFTSLTGGAAPN